MNLSKTEKEVKKIKTAGRILAETAKRILAESREGVKLIDLDKLARKLIEDAGAKPAFLGYKPYGAKKAYPASICASVNETIVHGIPDEYKLKPGDLLKLDFGVCYEGYYADAAWTVGIGKIHEKSENLISVTKKALELAIKESRIGNTLGDIGFAISSFVSKSGFSVVDGLTGHGVGKKLHEPPNIFNFGKKGEGIELEEGMVFAIEPMISAGSPQILQGEDDSFRTADGSLSAHFEHTVLVTKGDPEVLTNFEE